MQAGLTLRTGLTRLAPNRPETTRVTCRAHKAITELALGTASQDTQGAFVGIGVESGKSKVVGRRLGSGKDRGGETENGGEMREADHGVAPRSRR